MSELISITAAGNTMAPALAVLRELGYEVSRDREGLQLYRAVSARCSLSAEDPLLLLGLAKLFESRGNSWQPSDAEVAALLDLHGDGA